VMDPTMAVGGSTQIEYEDQLQEYELPDGATEQNAPQSQLADEFPQVDTALRIDPPLTLKVPKRTEALSRDAQIRESAFSPAAHVNAKNTNTAHVLGPLKTVPGRHRAKLDSLAAAHKSGQGAHQNSIADQRLLARASQRSGKVQNEGQAYLAAAITHDNLGQFPEAIECYTKLLGVCERLGDAAGVGLARNCLGVDCFLIAAPLSQGSHYDARRPLSPESRAYLNRAVEHHKGHLAAAQGSEGGQFVACTNLGLSLALLGDVPTATAQHQEALRVAIALQSQSGQAIAVGNLGLLAMRTGEYATAKACLEQHLSLAQTLDDPTAETTAWMLLGQLYAVEKDLGPAVEAYEEAQKIAQHMGRSGLVKRIACSIGAARGEQALANHMASLAKFAAMGYAGAAAEANAKRR